MTARQNPPTAPLRRAKYIAVDVDVRSRRSLASLLAVWPNAQTPGRVNQRVPLWLVLSGLTAPRPGRGVGIPVSQRTIEAVARVGGRIVITVYPPGPD